MAFDENYTDRLSISVRTWQISIMLTGEGPVSANSSIQKGADMLNTLFFYVSGLSLLIHVLSLIKCNKEEKMQKKKIAFVVNASYS